MARINHWLEQFESRNLRERSLLLITLLVMLLFLGYQFWLGPKLKERQIWFNQIDKTRQQTEQFSTQMVKLEAVMQQDPDRDNRQRLKQVRAESTQLDSRLKQEQQTMISPEMMPDVLQDVLDDLPLVLVSLRKLPPEVEIDSDIEDVPRVYRHGLRLELEGSYSDTLDYLERLEKLPWRLAWEALDIRMKRYPRATIILNLYTLSFDEVWLGV